ncbi:NAD-P-binding protein [Rickenella mellea]|uniref:NAD-P-binding protein n=1 Tax=Rickenella mellea TaxID=50990 RepID=A0A4Y7Q031_9AGAM|nr:NAD-P-binding protein [Rickenella mellea]
MHMAPVRNARSVFNEVPIGLPDPGRTVKYDDSQTIDLDDVDLGGGFLVKVLYVSMDPYLRNRMREPSPKNLRPPFIIGDPLVNFGIGVVLRSENPEMKVDDHIYGFLPFQEYAILKETKAFRVISNEANIPWSAYVGVCSMPGQTAYYGWRALAEAKKGETLFVSAGPVGSFVIQLAKHEGLKVIASAGSDEKVQFIKSIGADVAFNYKKELTTEILDKEGPINIYWDHVGGETLDAALDAAAHFARFVECGMMSQNNATPENPPYIPKNLQLVIGKTLTIRGFVVTVFEDQYKEDFYAEIPSRVAKGELKYVEDVTVGLEGVGQALLNVQTGANRGKSVIRVSQSQ